MLTCNVHTDTLFCRLMMLRGRVSATAIVADFYKGLYQEMNLLGDGQKPFCRKVFSRRLI